MGTFGPAYDPEIDGPPIECQHENIRGHMLSQPEGRWLTLSEIAKDLGYPEASVSAQLRHLRKPRFGAYAVEKRRRDEARVWEYRVRSAFRLTG